MMKQNTIKDQGYYDVSTGKKVKATDNKFLEQKHVELANKKKKKSRIDDIVPSSEFLFGKQYIPNPKQIAEEMTIGLFDPSVGDKIDKTILHHNNMVINRGKILTYSRDVLGIEFGPRMTTMGMGGGGKGGWVPPLGAPELPTWYNLIPDGYDTSPHISGWSHEQKAEYVISGAYSRHLFSSNETIEELDNILADYADYRSHMDEINDVLSEEKNAETKTEADPPRDTSVDPVISKNTAYQKFRKIISGKYDKPTIKKLWHDKGGKEWLNEWTDKYGPINNLADIEKAKADWVKVYGYLPSNIPIDSKNTTEKITDAETGQQFDKSEGMNDGKDEQKHDGEEWQTDDATISNRKAIEQSYVDDGYTTLEARQMFMDLYKEKTQSKSNPEKPSDSSGSEKMSPSDNIMKNKTSIINNYLAQGYEQSIAIKMFLELLENAKKNGMTQTKTQTDNGFSTTDIDVEREPGENEDDKKKRRKPEPDPRRRPDPRYPDPRDPDPKKDPVDENPAEEKAFSKNEKTPTAGDLRPLFKRGGQDILLITEAEKLEEVQDWTLYDLPIPNGEDPDNPLYLKNMRDNYYRFYGTDGKYRHPQLYKGKPRTQYYEPERMKTMMPLMHGPITWTGFNDPYDTRRFDTPTDAYRTSESTSGEYARRMGGIYTDEANVYTQPHAHPHGGISQIDLMLSLK